MAGPDQTSASSRRWMPVSVSPESASWQTNKLVLGFLLIVFLLYIAPGPPGYAQSLSLPIMIEQARSNGVEVDGIATNALNRLGVVYDSRADLQAVFGIGSSLDTRRLLDWARSYPDSSALPLRRFDKTFARMIAQWDDPGTLGASGQPTVRGLP